MLQDEDNNSEEANKKGRNKLNNKVTFAVTADSVVDNYSSSTISAPPTATATTVTATTSTSLAASSSVVPSATKKKLNATKTTHEIILERLAAAKERKEREEKGNSKAITDAAALVASEGQAAPLDCKATTIASAEVVSSLSIQFIRNNANGKNTTNKQQGGRERDLDLDLIAIRRDFDTNEELLRRIEDAAITTNTHTHANDEDEEKKKRLASAALLATIGVVKKSIASKNKSSATLLLPTSSSNKSSTKSSATCGANTAAPAASNNSVGGGINPTSKTIKSVPSLEATSVLSVTKGCYSAPAIASSTKDSQLGLDSAAAGGKKAVAGGGERWQP